MPLTLAQHCRESQPQTCPCAVHDCRIRPSCMKHFAGKRFLKTPPSSAPGVARCTASKPGFRAARSFRKSRSTSRSTGETATVFSIRMPRISYGSLTSRRFFSAPRYFLPPQPLSAANSGALPAGAGSPHPFTAPAASACFKSRAGQKKPYLSARRGA